VRAGPKRNAGQAEVEFGPRRELAEVGPREGRGRSGLGRLGSWAGLVWGLGLFFFLFLSHFYF
jgi:hypothetical protein